MSSVYELENSTTPILDDVEMSLERETNQLESDLRQIARVIFSEDHSLSEHNNYWIELDGIDGRHEVFISEQNLRSGTTVLTLREPILED